MGSGVARHQRIFSICVTLHMLKHRAKCYEKAFLQLNSSKIDPIIHVPARSPVPSSSPRVLKLVCYYSFPYKDDLKPERIDPGLCTHINIASLAVTNKSLSEITPEISKVIKEVVALKTQKPLLKVLLCIGGYSAPGGFNDMVKKHEDRKRFIRQVLQVLKDYSLDGVDLDWEFPSWPEEDKQEKIDFNVLLREFREAFEEEHKPFLLSVAVGSPGSIIDQSYDVEEMAKHVDYVNLMAYDYHFYVWYFPVTGANAPLFRRPGEKGFLATLNTNWSSWYWVQKGMPKEKIVVGVPTYGHSFRLVNADNHGWSAPVSDIGKLGSNGFVTYPEVCWFLTKEGAAHEYDMDSQVPYAYLGQEWVSYDDMRSIASKATYVANHFFAGVMVFSLNQDDYNGLCDGAPFVLTQQVRNVLFDQL
ncbi:Probable chitinase 10 [Gryllus bimaculatus]|nr:Probable chitinase 10 [Gryllus bimaculatus]